MQVSRQRQRWVVVFAIAVAVHLLVILPFLHLLIFKIISTEPGPTLEPPPIRPYELVLEPDEEEETDDDETRQIVSVDQPASEVPEEADYEDRVNRSVEEETAARQRGAPIPRPTQASQPVRRSSEQTEQRQERDEVSDVLEDSREPTETDPTLQEEIAAVFEPTERGAAPAHRERPDQTDDPNADDPRDEDESRLDLAAFNPSYESARDFVAVPGAPSPDHLDLPQGDRDQINSFENLYWSYWDRIKQQVRPHWRPARVYRDRDPTGRVFGVEDRYTVLRVTLNGDGSLRHVYLERSSDLDFLDREAIRAIRSAEPFTNVPEGLKDDRGLLSFRFGFYFEVNSSNFRIRREDW